MAARKKIAKDKVREKKNRVRRAKARARREALRQVVKAATRNISPEISAHGVLGSVLPAGATAVIPLPILTSTANKP